MGFYLQFSLYIHSLDIHINSTLSEVNKYDDRLLTCYKIRLKVFNTPHRAEHTVLKETNFYRVAHGSRHKRHFGNYVIT